MTNLLKILEIPDTHIPNHDKAAWALLLKAMRWWQPNIIRIIGDFGDFESVMQHRKNPAESARFLREDIDSVNKGLDQLDALKAKRKVYCFGNHESRVSRYLCDRAPELFKDLNLQKELRLKERGWEYVKYGSDHKLGKVYATHDVNSAGKNSVDKALETYQASIITGHTHRMRYIVEGNALGDAQLSASFGWLGDVEKIDYQQRMKAKKAYVLGFGIGYMDSRSGIIYYSPVPIVKNTVCVEGRVFKV